ncbi:MAG TPA: hypothetical protein VK558_08275 [Patescibacteria group bacterium]|nr:hypothetical protein [Patescibacteria group bacterium]
MIPRAALTKLAKLVAQDLTDGHMSGGLQGVGEALAAAPNGVPDVLDLLAKEAGKKKPNGALVDAYGFMVGQALEILRYGVERNASNAVEAVAAVRAKVRSLVEDGKLDPGTLLLILRQFASAKLDLGDDLQELMASLIDHESVSILPGKAEIDDTLAEMALACGGDAFALHAELAEQTSTFPESHRAGIVAALLGAADPSLREAAIGWLLDSGPTTRRDTASLLQQAASAGVVSGTMLRRLITIRNWLPEDERPAVDAVIRTCRQKGIECAPLKAGAVREVVASGIDGSGAQSLFVVVKDGRRQATAALLLKQGVGVRDAWVNAGLTKAEADGFLFQVETQADCYDSSLDHVRLTLGHALAAARESGVLPPFGLVDVVERSGLPSINPEAAPVASLVAQLLSDIPAGRQNAATLAEALKGSATWEDNFLFLESWFEDDGAIDALLEGKQLSAKRRAALVLDKYLPARRARWAELLAWNALTLRQDEATEDDWMDFALVANELLGDRPLSEIPLMTVIAEKTVGAWETRLF